MLDVNVNDDDDDDDDGDMGHVPSKEVNSHNSMPDYAAGSCLPSCFPGHVLHFPGNYCDHISMQII